MFWLFFLAFIGVLLFLSISYILRKKSTLYVIPKSEESESLKSYFFQVPYSLKNVNIDQFLRKNRPYKRKTKIDEGSFTSFFN